MTFFEMRFPAKVGLRAVSSPGWKTDVVPFGGGHEQANQKWQSPLWRFTIPVTQEKSQIDEIQSFFLAIAKGMAQRFRFKDWDDFAATDQHNKNRPVIGTGNGSLTQFQLIKTYNFMGQSFDRTISKPVQGVPDGRNTVKIYIDEALQQSGWTVDAATGLVTFGSAPASGTITTDYEFDVPVRMDTDELAKVSIVQGNEGVRSIEAFDLVEVRV